MDAHPEAGEVSVPEECFALADRQGIDRAPERTSLFGLGMAGSREKLRGGGGVSLGPRSPPTLAVAWRTESRARCAYRAVVVTIR